MAPHSISPHRTVPHRTALLMLVGCDTAALVPSYLLAFRLILARGIFLPFSRVGGTHLCRNSLFFACARGQSPPPLVVELIDVSASSGLVILLSVLSPAASGWILDPIDPALFLPTEGSTGARWW